MKPSVLLIGGGGHAKSVIDTLIHSNELEIVGIIDVKEKVGEEISGIKVIGTDADLPSYYAKGIRYAFISLGSIGIPNARIKLYHKLKKIGFSFPNIIDPTAILAENIQFGVGNFIGKGVIINTTTTIGDHCIINTGSIIEHDCNIENFIHLGPRSILCGGVQIGENSHIGASATILQYKKVGSNSIIGAGSLVNKDIPTYQTAYGIPCRIIEKIGGKI
ncbi:acetyltransferase [Cellulosilyticum lentocellum]|uniref:Sugar O-acyltransferase, sialic acid O-acetyltransferase NeuD family n=1 Tax=Cellulosilyticum lentocellum (strain ATCC 49066 / DSM 5427 / NCIMB 11756 / RHM5) TaxID=642492 RepID=F2JT45_CELLD|nr:acetyltransferase [Cellulosilyticum lentocellum]ADZ85264.1 sugar O-acyltransferase, sialic acid O-acetyltransferase NeuD family [Cellulosilyticum lentocellum DSM 5427]